MKPIDRVLAELAACMRQVRRIERALGELLGQHPGRKLWTAAELAEVRRRYANEPTRAIARDMFRTESSVNQAAAKLGLHKSAEYFASGKPYEGFGRTREARKHWFKKGDGRGGIKSAAQLQKFLAAGKKSRFQKGRKPANTWKPIGTETVTKDGYLVRKMTDVGGYNNDDWKFVHHLVWEKRHRRTVPAGHAVVFKDGNKRNFKPGNLELLSRAQLMAKNTIHRYPLELKKTIRALGKLKRTIQRKQDEKD